MPTSHAEREKNFFSDGKSLRTWMHILKSQMMYLEVKQ